MSIKYSLSTGTLRCSARESRCWRTALLSWNKVWAFLFILINTYTSFSTSGFPVELDPFYNNTIFSTSFSGGFLGFVKSDDPNKHTLPESKLPEWEVYNEHKSRTEMLFNRTSDMHPDMRSIKTDSKLLKRCEWVTIYLLFSRID